MPLRMKSISPSSSGGGSSFGMMAATVVDPEEGAPALEGIELELDSLWITNGFFPFLGAVAFRFLPRGTGTGANKSSKEQSSSFGGRSAMESKANLRYVNCVMGW